MVVTVGYKTSDAILSAVQNQALFMIIVALDINELVDVCVLGTALSREDKGISTSESSNTSS